MSKKQVVIIGAGAAGLMAAGQAKLHGAGQVILLEKMKRPGRKICITGKGRCNITNSASVAEFIDHFGKNGRFLHQAFSHFFSTELVEFFTENGLPVTLERGGRYFPSSGKAPDILKVFLSWLKELHIDLRQNCEVTEILTEDGKVSGIATKQGTIGCDSVILATGGASYPATGSTGDGYSFAKALGHTILPIRPALIPLEIKGGIAPGLAGLELRNVGVKLLIAGKKKRQLFGELHFLQYAVGGPTILTLSGEAVDALRTQKKVELLVDLKAALSEQKLDARLIRDFEKRYKEPFNDVLRGLLPAKLVPLCLETTAIPAKKLAGEISRKERKRLLHWLKEQRLEVSGHRPLKEAIVTAGGVNLKEVVPRTMESKMVQGLYFAGEVLDLNGNTGGYNLQAAFSTGWLAGRCAAQGDRS
jgi:predicted Rossmann fold flavoprotein